MSDAIWDRLDAYTTQFKEGLDEDPNAVFLPRVNNRDARDLVEREHGVHPGMGIKILLAQLQTWMFLVDVSAQILHEHSSYELFQFPILQTLRQE
jgi:hypothetical protein